jgi:hypothetical protein
MASSCVEVAAVTPDMLAWQGTAQEALAHMSEARGIQDLLHRSHELWCGPNCNRSTACTYLHYPREPATAFRPVTT